MRSRCEVGRERGGRVSARACPLTKIIKMWRRAGGAGDKSGREAPGHGGRGRRARGTYAAPVVDHRERVVVEGRVDHAPVPLRKGAKRRLVGVREGVVREREAIHAADDARHARAVVGRRPRRVVDAVRVGAAGAAVGAPTPRGGRRVVVDAGGVHAAAGGGRRPHGHGGHQEGGQSEPHRPSERQTRGRHERRHPFLCAGAHYVMRFCSQVVRA